MTRTRPVWLNPMNPHATGNLPEPTMPNLGQVSARLRFDARGVEIQLTTASPVTAFMLRAGATPLADGLDSAGINLRGMGVELDE